MPHAVRAEHGRSVRDLTCVVHVSMAAPATASVYFQCMLVIECLGGGVRHEHHLVSQWAHLLGLKSLLLNQDHHLRLLLLNSHAILDVGGLLLESHLSVLNPSFGSMKL